MSTVMNKKRYPSETYPKVRLQPAIYAKAARIAAARGQTVTAFHTEALRREIERYEHETPDGEKVTK